MSQNESNGSKMTPKDIAWIKRAAAAHAIRELNEISRNGGLATVLPSNWHGIDDFTRRLFPLPKVARQRVLRDPQSPGTEWRVVELLGVPTLMWRRAASHELGASEWRCYPTDNGGVHHLPSPARCDLWSSLFAQPTIEVEDDGSVSDA